MMDPSLTRIIIYIADSDEHVSMESGPSCHRSTSDNPVFLVRLSPDLVSRPLLSKLGLRLNVSPIFSMAAHFERTLPDHRQHLLPSLAKSILTPPAVTCLILYATGPNASAFSATVAMLSIPIFVVLRRSKYALSREDLMATQLNTCVIPRGVGKWH
ncbi:hypothetical protein C8R42DRAFT_370058 [Lentinula raphanica]|nr:hypothetical protein C8R42DRAFT_370058 [Lentinula raphanica]